MKDATSAEIWELARVGEELDPFEYLITRAMFDEYRDIVGDPEAAYPTVAGRHSLRAFTHRYGPAKLMNTGTESEYFNPVVPDRIIRVTARIVDKYERRGKPYLVVESMAIDEDDRPIERSRLIGMSAQPSRPLFAAVSGKWESGQAS
jgi:hypothetical protein